MISKELLKNVLYGEDIDNISIISNSVKFEYSHYVNGIFQYRRKTVINIYELAFECKKWAYKNCSEIISYTEGAEIYQTQLGRKIKRIYGNTEEQAIFKACQWILDNKEGI